MQTQIDTNFRATIDDRLLRSLLQKGRSFVVGGLLNTPGKRVNRLREDLGLRQVDLAQTVGVRQNYISAIEVGTAMPNADIMAKIAKALGTTLDFIMMLSDDPLPAKDAQQPTRLADEAEEAANIIDAMPPKWRTRVIEAVRRLNDDYAEHVQQNHTITLLLESIEKEKGKEARLALMRRLGL